jgi:Uma2 family endonuclease
MVQMLSNPPKTIMEVYKMLPEGTLAELIDGSIYMTPPPNYNHQEISLKLSARIFVSIEKKINSGKVIAAPFGVFLDENENAVQPDIVFVRAKNKSIIKRDAIHGVPDLLIEILSPGNRNHDLRRKKLLYQTFEVPEYWIIDPNTNEAIGFEIREGKYIEFCRGCGKIKSRILKGVFKF